MRQSDEVAAHAKMFVGDFWFGVPGASNYLVASDGRVASLVKRRPRILRPLRCGEYQAVQLRCDDGSYRREYVHRLVLECIHGPAPEGMEARHLDGNRDNNALGNLRWGTRKENHADKKLHGTTAIGERNPQARLTAEKVREMRAMYASGGHTYAELAARFGVSTMTALRAIKKEAWSHV